jgi:hypothetical protein
VKIKSSINPEIVKKAAAYLLLLLIMAQSFYSATIYIWFQVNRAYITQAFCVNKSRPEMKCGGKCYLAKQLQKADEQNPPQQLKEWVQIAPFLISDATTTFVTPVHTLNHGIGTGTVYQYLHPTGVFHPPLA